MEVVVVCGGVVRSLIRQSNVIVVLLLNFFASLTSLVADYTAASEMQPLHQPALSTAVQRLAEGRPDRIEYPPDELPSILNPNQVIAC